MSFLKDNIRGWLFSDNVIDLNAASVKTTTPQLEANISSLALTALNWIGESVQKVRIHLQEGLSVPQVIQTPTGVSAELLHLLERPNPLYTGRLMRNLVARDRGLYGQGYIRIVRSNANGMPERLWYMPYKNISKATNANGALSYYTYEGVDGETRRVQPEDMLRFTRGLNRTDPLEGEGYWDNLGSVLYIDEEALRFTAEVFQNALTGIMVSLDSGGGSSVRYTISRAAADLFEKKLKDGFGGDNKGALIYTNAPYRTERLEPSFTELNLLQFHNLAEERVLSPTGISPTTLGLGTGLQHTRITATASEYDRKSWEDGVLPVAESICDALTAQLVPEFFDASEEISVGYNVSHISALRYTPAEVINMVTAGIIDATRAQSLLQLN